MLTDIEISGFKSILKKTFPLRKLTLLSGFNNSGKSTVIQALRMFCNSYEKNIPLLTGHGAVDEIRSKFVISSEPISFKCGFKNNRVELFSLNERGFSKPGTAPLICYISADRWGPKISLPIDRTLGEFPVIGDHGEYVIGFLDALRNVIVPPHLHHPNAQGSTLEYQIMGWMEEIAPGIDLKYEIDSKRDSAHVEFDSFRPTNVGFGLSYCLPILASILGMASQEPVNGWDNEWGNDWEFQKKSRGILLMLENPEAHLHPSGQTALGRLIALGARAGLQLIVETQSDHLMDGIRISIREEILEPSEVIFHYLTRNKDGETEFLTPEINRLGKLSFWPDGFFDQTLKNRSKLAR